MIRVKYVEWLLLDNQWLHSVSQGLAPKCSHMKTAYKRGLKQTLDKESFQVIVLYSEPGPRKRHPRLATILYDSNSCNYKIKYKKPRYANIDILELDS